MTGRVAMLARFCKSYRQSILWQNSEVAFREMRDWSAEDSAIKTIKCAVKKLKHAKSDGDVGFFSSHLIYASDAYFCQLAMLFNVVYVHGYIATP